MESFESPGNLNQNTPNFLLAESSSIFGVEDHLFIQIPVVGKLHNDAILWGRVLEIVGGLLNEALFIADDVGVMDWREDSCLIECILFLALV